MKKQNTKTEVEGIASEVAPKLDISHLLEFFLMESIPETEWMHLDDAFNRTSLASGISKGRLVDIIVEIDRRFSGRNRRDSVTHFRIPPHLQVPESGEGFKRAMETLSKTRAEYEKAEREAQEFESRREALANAIAVRERAQQSVEVAEYFATELKQELDRLDGVIETVCYSTASVGQNSTNAFRELIICNGRKHAITLALKDHPKRMEKMREELRQIDAQIKKLNGEIPNE